MITLINTSSTGEFGESVLFQPVLKAYPTHHSWLITPHIFLGHLEWHWKSFTRQMDRTCQMIQSLNWWTSAPTQLLSAQQTGLTNIKDIYTLYKPFIISAINHLATDPSIDENTKYNRWVRRSLLLFLGDALSWLTGTATTKDVNSIKQRVNKLIETQSMQQETMVHILSILNVTWFAAQVNRQHVNILMDRDDEMVQDVNNHYNLTTSLATSLSYYQLILHIRSILVNLCDLLSYIKSAPCTSWTTSMQPLLEHYHPTFYPLQTSNKCYPTLRSLCLPLCIYQYHLRIHYTFIDTCAHMFSLQTDSFTMYRCSYSWSDTTNINVQNFHLGHPSWKFYSMLWSWH